MVTRRAIVALLIVSCVAELVLCDKGIHLFRTIAIIIETNAGCWNRFFSHFSKVLKYIFVKSEVILILTISTAISISLSKKGRLIVL